MDELNEYLTKNDNADGVIMTSIETKNGQTKRQLGLYILNLEYLELIYKLIQNDDLNLQLKERSIPINQTRLKLFDQYNIQASRKQILPFLDKFVKNFGN